MLYVLNLNSALLLPILMDYSLFWNGNNKSTNGKSSYWHHPLFPSVTSQDPSLTLVAMALENVYYTNGQAVQQIK